MKILSLFLILSVLSGGVLCAFDVLGGEDIGVKGGDGSLSVAYDEEALADTKNGSPKEPSILEKKLAFERGLASGVYEKTTQMVDDVSSVLSKSDAYGKCKEKYGHVVDKAKEGLHHVQEIGDLDKTKQKFSKAKDTMEESSVCKAKEAWTNTKEKIANVKEGVAEKVPGAAETMENIKRTGQDMQKIHHTVWDERSLKRKTSGFFTELTANFSDLATTAASNKIMEPTLGVLQLVGLSISYGVHIWVCFVSSIVLAKTLTRRQYMEIQSKIYPIHFRALVGGLSCALVAHCLKNRNLWSFQVYTILLSFCLALFNRFYGKPRATKLFFARMKMEREGRQDENLADPPTEPTSDAKSSRQLKSLETLSFVVDVATLLTLTAQAVHIGKQLVVV